MFRIAFIISFMIAPLLMTSQYDWRLEKAKNGIQVYSSKVPNSEFRATKVECTLEGDYDKLISVISDVDGMTDWVFKSSSCEIVERYSELDFLYTVVTEMPWPMDDRESVIHLQFHTKNLPDSISIIGTEAEEPLPEKPDLIRVTNYHATWSVTMPEEGKIHIEYLLKLDPGGGIPPWMVNIMVEKGPYQTFLGLSEKLKELD